MQNFHDFNNLSGKVLVASPNTPSDSYFSRAVIYIIEHTANHISGLQINSPIPRELNADLKTDYFLNHHDSALLPDIDLHYGGPVDVERGFILHSGGKPKSHKVMLSFDFDALKGSRPKNSMLLLGYCDWNAHQLEQEIRQNLWVVAGASEDVIFAKNNTSKWGMALGKCHIAPWMYSAKVGRC